MSDEAEAVKAAIAEWEQKPGPCVGDYCEPENGVLRRIAAIRNDDVKLTDAFQSRFTFERDGDVSYASGGILNLPPISADSLRQKPGRKLGGVQLRSDSSHTNLNCRVFKV
jgi:hypothetical protein